MRDFNYSKIKEKKWDLEILGLVAAIYKEAGKQEMYLKQRPEELEKLVEIAKVQSAQSLNAIIRESVHRWAFSPHRLYWYIWTVNLLLERAVISVWMHYLEILSVISN